MLQIYVFGPTKKGFLDIDPSTSLSLEAVTDLFDEDLTSGEFSLPVDIPWTDTNRKILGFAERLENFSSLSGGIRGAKSYKCIVYENGFAELPAAKFTILSKSGSLAYTAGKFSATISGTKGLFGTQIKNKKLTDLNLGGIISFSTESRQFATDVMHGLYPAYNYLVFAPVAIEEFFQTDRPDYDDEFLAKDTVNTVVVSGSDWSFKNPAGSTKTSYRTVPFFKMKYIVKKIFEEIGYAVTGEFMTSTDWDDIVIFNQFSLENYAPSTGDDFNRKLVPKNHVPDMLISDFLKGIFSFFNIYTSFTGAAQVELNYRKKIFQNRKVLKITELVTDKFTSTFNPDDSDGDGYKLNYTWDENDGFYSDRVKDLSDKTIIGSVATFGDLETLDIGRTLTTDDIAYVEADNMYYEIADSTSTPKKWDAYAENLDFYQSGDGSNEIDIPLSTLCTYVELDPDTQLFVKRNYVGTRQSGCYINNKGAHVVNPFGLRLFYAKMLSIDGVVQPVTFNHNRNAANAQIEMYSLAWNGSKGMALNFHTAWQAVKQNMEVVKTSVRGNQKTISDISYHNCYEINGTLFLMNKIDRTIPLKASLDVELVPI